MINKSMICRTANRLTKSGYSRSEAFKAAWRLAKLPAITTKVSGVTFGNRQTALEHLTRYNPSDVTFVLATDSRNAYDRNAIAVIARVNGKGAAVIGYIPRTLAADICPLITAGVFFKASGAIVGGYEPYMNYGARLTLEIA